VVIVDDDPDMRLLLRTVLKRHGYDVLGEAGDGVEAMAWFHALHPDMMVVDLTMPHMGGIELINRVRALSKMPLVGYSAAPSDEDQRQLLRLGVPLVAKDAGVAALVRVLDAVGGDTAAPT
jgi:DNA-binding response OmpR family regulator